MPLEIREVIIKAKLERDWSDDRESPALDGAGLEQLKKDILAYCLEQLEEQRRRREKTEERWL